MSAPVDPVPTYWSLPEGPARDRFYDRQDGDARSAIDADRAARRAAILGTIEANRRPKPAANPAAA